MTSRARIRCLKTEEDWRTCREDLQTLTLCSAPDPYMNWEYQHAVWQLVAPGEPCWLVETFAGGEPLAAAFLWETRHERGPSEWKVLRSLDYNVMGMAPFVMRRGQEEAACRSLLAASDDIRRESGAHLVSLYKINAAHQSQLTRELEAQDKTFQLRVFNQSHEIHFRHGLDGYWQSKSAKSLRNIRRMARVLQRETGLPLKVGHLSATSPKAREEGWRHFERLLRRSWQLESHRHLSLRPELLERFYKETLPFWEEQGWLDLALLYLGEEAISFQLGLNIGERQRLVLMAYDRQYRRYSPGRILFYRQLEDVYQRGYRTIELGGEWDDWKEYWSNEQRPTLAISWSLGGLKGRAWSWFQRVRGSAYYAGTEPLPASP